MYEMSQCYICAKEFQCSLENDTYGKVYIMQFGDGELVDREGDAFFVECVYEYTTQHEVIELWYENEVLVIYDSDKPLKETLVILSESEVEEILREFHRIFKIKEEK